MRFSIAAAVATLSATVLAQGNLANIPTCAQNCFSSANLGDCSSLFDIACICKSSAITEVSCCALAACSAADIQTTIAFATTLCSGEGVTLNTNPDCGSSNSSSSASASASSASSASASSSASAAASASSSAAVTAISGTNTPSGSASRSASAAASSGSAAAASSAAAAFQTAGPVLGFGVAVVGMLAAL